MTTILYDGCLALFLARFDPFYNALLEPECTAERLFQYADEHFDFVGGCS